MIKAFTSRMAYALLASAIWSSAGAEYNANLSGVVSSVVTYTDSDRIYFRLQNQPSSNGECNATYFAIADGTPQNRRNQAFAQLLASKLANEPVNIGYDNTGDCVHGFIRVYRVG
jgi:hypothetical protein